MIEHPIRFSYSLATMILFGSGVSADFQANNGWAIYDLVGLALASLALAQTIKKASTPER